MERLPSCLPPLPPTSLLLTVISGLEVCYVIVCYVIVCYVIVCTLAVLPDTRRAPQVLEFLECCWFTCWTENVERNASAVLDQDHN